MTPTRTPEEIFAKPYGRLLVREADGGYSAEVIEFPGCIAEGDTAEEAVASVERTALAWIDAQLEKNQKIPAPISGSDYSGRILVRLPRSLHRSLALKAAADGTSLNQEVVAAVSCWVGADDLYRKLTENVARQQTALMLYGAGASVGATMGGHQTRGESMAMALTHRQQQPQSHDVLDMLAGRER